MRFLSYHERRTRGTFDFPIELYHVDASHPRYEMPFHWHMETELLLVKSGSFCLIADGGESVIGAGQSVYIPSGVVHGGVPSDCTYECVVFDANRFFEDSNILRKRFADAFGGSQTVRIFSPDGREGEVILDIFGAMEAGGVGYEFETIGSLWRLLGLLLRECPEEGSRSSNPHAGASHAEQLKDVLRMIRSDYKKELTLDDLARRAGMSPRYLCRVFRTVTGHTPVDYLNYYRVECSAELLRGTDESITEIALSCGFSDPGYFSRTFRRHKGCSPSEYRKSAEK